MMDGTSSSLTVIIILGIRLVQGRGSRGSWGNFTLVPKVMEECLGPYTDTALYQGGYALIYASGLSAGFAASIPVQRQ
jgi:hypothetical protein